MPYSDNLYSALDDDSDVEPIGESSSQHGRQYHGLGVTPGTAWWNAAAGSGYVDDESVDPADAVDVVEDPQDLSPTDGYFGAATRSPAAPVRPTSSNVPHVPNVMVEDPSLQRSAAEGKAREAEQERRRNIQTPLEEDEGEDDGPPPSQNLPLSPSTQQHPMTPPQQRSTTPSSTSAGAAYYTPSSHSRSSPAAATPSSYTTYSTRRPAYHHGDRFPFLPREAPPAYTPSPTTTTTSPTSPRGFPDSSRSYNTFPQHHGAFSPSSDAVVNMGRPEETRALLGHQPESMRDRGEGGGGDGAPSPGWGDRLRRAREHVNAGNLKLAVIAVLLLLVTSGFISSLVTGTRGGVSVTRLSSCLFGVQVQVQLGHDTQTVFVGQDIWAGHSLVSSSPVFYPFNIPN